MAKIVYCGELNRTPDAPDHLGIRQGLEGYEHIIVDPVLDGPEEAIRQVNEYKPDVVIHGNTDSLMMGLAPKMKGKQIFWMLDYQPRENLYNWGPWNLEGYDLIFVSNREQLEMWERRMGCPARYLTHGCVVQKPVKDDRFYHKAIFIGNNGGGGWFEERRRLLDQIEFDTINEHDVEKRNEVWRNMPAIYHTSDCVIDVSHSWTSDGYASGRYFYSAGLGGCSITKRFPGCEELYPEGTKAYFDTPEEANELIEYYSTHPKEREKLKMKAWRWNRDHHHYKFKFKEILK